MNNLTITDRQAIARTVDKLQAIQGNGLLPLSYTRTELNAIEEHLVYVGGAVLLNKIDLATIYVDRIDLEFRAKRITWKQRSELITETVRTLAERFEMKEASLSSRISEMRRWPYDERIDGLQAHHYRAVPAGMDHEQAKLVLRDAAAQGESAAWVQAACYEQMEAAKQSPGSTVAIPPDEMKNIMSNGAGDWTGWGLADQWLHRHDVERVVRESATRYLIHSSSGVLTIEADTPIRFTTKETT